jgi:hypothetical protein
MPVIGVDIEHERADPKRYTCQRGAGHAAVRADGANPASQLKPLADNVGQLVKNFGQVAARSFLKQDRGHKKVHVQRRYAFRQLLERRIQRQAEVVFFKGPPEFSRKRLLELPMNHFERNGKSVPGAHRTGDELQALGEKLLEAA